MTGFLTPLVAFDQIDDETLNRCLIEWGHRMGPLHRPRFGAFGGSHGLFHEGRVVAVVATEQMVAAQTCGVTRQQGFELARVCAERPGLCRAILRLWREFAFPAFAQVSGKPWAISYQDRAQHQGTLYRMDGWVRLGQTSSGTDDRGRDGTRKGRRKTVWGWTIEPGLMAAARERERELFG